VAQEQRKSVMQDQEVMRSPYCAGSVRRYHTWPVIREQTVADHSFHVLRLYWTLFGYVPPEIASYIIWHDMGELWTGDLPYPVKRDNYALKKTCDDIEQQALAEMGGDTASITTDQEKRVKFCDLLEMLEYALHEVSLGNQYATVVVSRIVTALKGFLWASLEMTAAGRRYVDNILSRGEEYE
jgi:5'-deoxynucleotidase YfbR-like HD superfamily hydrolase